MSPTENGEARRLSTKGDGRGEEGGMEETKRGETKGSDKARKRRNGKGKVSSAQ